MLLQQGLYRRLLSAQAKRAAVQSEFQLMAGYLEHLDTLMEATRNIEQSMEKLHATYAQKKAVVQRPTVQWTDSTEIDQLFDQSQQHKDDIAAELDKMKRFLTDTRKIYAVEAPDGISDAMNQEDLQQVSHIIEEAALYEDKEEIEAQHRAYAVDAPDGISDGDIQADMKQVRDIIDDAEFKENPKAGQMKGRIDEALHLNPDVKDK